MWADKSTADIDAELDAMAGGGARWVRFDVGWCAFEETKGGFAEYFAARLDYIVDGALNRGIEPQLLIIGTPSWANGGAGQFAPPTNPQDISGFVYKLVSRYEGRVNRFEIWNEPNLRHFWRPAPSAAGYARLLEPAYHAAKSANPDAVVISAGIDGNDTDYLQAMYDAGAGEHFDLLGLHTYCGNRSPYEPPHEYNTRWNYYGLSTTRAVMDANGDSAKHIWISEFGWQTSKVGEWPVSETSQSVYVAQAYQRLFDEFPYVDAMLVYNIRDDSTDPTNPYVHLGLLRHDFTAKPAYYSFSRTSGQLWPRGRAWAQSRMIEYRHPNVVGVILPSAWGETSVTIQRLTAGARQWEDIRAGTTVSGVFQTGIAPTATALYRAVIQNHETSTGVRIQVRAGATIGVSRSSVRRGQAMSVLGKIVFAPGKSVYLQRKTSSRWINVARVLTDAAGRYRFARRHSRIGYYYYRAKFAGTPSLVGTYSRSVRVAVH